MDAGAAKYLEENVGGVLAKALSEMAKVQPKDTLSVWTRAPAPKVWGVDAPLDHSQPMKLPCCHSGPVVSTDGQDAVFHGQSTGKTITFSTWKLNEP